MESWRTVWRNGVVPLLSTASLQALRKAIAEDDKRLLQKQTTSPPPLSCVSDWPVEGACALGYCAWQGDGLETVGEVEDWFGKFCYAIDQRIGEPAVCRHWLNHWDDTPRSTVFAEMLPEIDLALQQRGETA